MGSQQARDMKEQMDQGNIRREQVMIWHLRNNHYPPHPYFMVQVALKAVDLANEGQWDEEIDLPEGVAFRDGRPVVSVANAVESLHLHSFLDTRDEG